MLNLLVLTPLGKAYDGNVDEVYVETSKGVLGILPKHTPLLSTLADRGVMKIKKGKEILYFSLYHGAIEVKPDRTIVLTESAFKADSEEEAKARFTKNRDPLSFEDKSVEIGEKYIRHEK